MAMGKITTTITVRNMIDEALAKRGVISVDAIRVVTLRNVLVDTGATHLCLPTTVIERLGLDESRQVDVMTAAGPRTTRTFKGGEVIIEDRSSTNEIIELPGDADPLLGVIPLEAMGIELDLQKQQIRLLPNDSIRTYLLAY